MLCRNVCSVRPDLTGVLLPELEMRIMLSTMLSVHIIFKLAGCMSIMYKAELCA